MHEAMDIKADSEKWKEIRQERKVCQEVPSTRLKCQEALYVVYMQTIAMRVLNSKALGTTNGFLF